LQGLLILLSPDMSENPMKLSAWGNRRGSWHDVLPGVRVHGMKYMGAGMTAAIRQYAAALGEVDCSDIAYSILMAHTGVQGVLDTDHSSPSAHEWRAMDGHANYIALGHIHKPFDFDNRIFNPGSLESNSVAEYDWLERGCLLVDVDTEEAETVHKVARVESPKREFVRMTVKVDQADSQEALLDECRRVLQRTVRDRATEKGRSKPIVELILTGNLPFDGAALNLRQISEAAQESLNALHVMVKNATSKFEVRSDGMDDSSLTRPQLEQLVMTNLYAGDARFSDNPAEWAAATVQVKSLAVAKAPAATIMQEIAATIARIE
jgi:DNA repair exonuclease SbcCD nuclease subunit